MADDDSDLDEKVTSLFGDKVRKPEDPQKEIVKAMNRVHALMKVGNNTRYLVINDSGTYDLQKKAEFDQLYTGHRVAIQTTNSEGMITRTKFVTWAGIWHDSPYRRQYNGFEFNPRKPLTQYDWEKLVVPPHITKCSPFNSFAGFRTKPQKGTCKLFKEYVFTILCGEDEFIYNWVTAWHAQILQCPGDKQGTAVVWQGLEGVGKSFFTEHYAELIDGDSKRFPIGRYCTMFDDPEQLFTRFTLPLHQKLYVVIEEAVFAGSIRQANQLRSMMTRTRMHVQPKGIDGWDAGDYARYVILGNADHIIHAGPQARRPLVLVASDARRNDRAFYDAVDEEWQDGGREAYMHDLMAFDCSLYNLRRAPRTRYLNTLKNKSLDLLGKFILHLLQTGQQCASKSDGRCEILKDDLRSLLIHWRRVTGARGDMPSEEDLTHALIKYLPSDVKTAKGRAQSIVDYARESKYDNDGKRKYFYIWPRLDVCRKVWEKYMEYEDFDWEDCLGWTDHQLLQNGRIIDVLNASLKF